MNKCKIITVPWLPSTWRGFALVWVVIIRKGYEHFIPHELIHIRQQKEHGWARYFWLYFWSHKFRAKMEVEAYKCDGRSDEYIVAILGAKYGVDEKVVREALENFKS